MTPHSLDKQKASVSVLLGSPAGLALIFVANLVQRPGGGTSPAELVPQLPAAIAVAAGMFALMVTCKNARLVPTVLMLLVCAPTSMSVGGIAVAGPVAFACAGGWLLGRLFTYFKIESLHDRVAVTIVTGAVEWAMWYAFTAGMTLVVWVIEALAGRAIGPYVMILAAVVCSAAAVSERVYVRASDGSTPEPEPELRPTTPMSASARGDESPSQSPS